MYLRLTHRVLEVFLARNLSPPPIDQKLVVGEGHAALETAAEYWARQDHEALARASQPVNPKTLMGNLKVRNLSVVPMTALIHEACAMEYGAFHSPRADGSKGYGPFNWRDSKIEYMTYVEAAVRHIMAAADREDIDPETGEYEVPHLALARATLGILIDALEHGTVIDNRPGNARGRVAELLRELKKK